MNRVPAEAVKNIKNVAEQHECGMRINLKQNYSEFRNPNSEF